MTSISNYDTILMYNVFCDVKNIESEKPSAIFYVTNCPDVRRYAGSLENFDDKNKKFTTVVKTLFPDVTRIECVSSRKDVKLDKNTFVISWESIKFEVKNFYSEVEITKSIKRIKLDKY